VRLTPEGSLEVSGVFRRVMERLERDLQRYAAALGAEHYEFPSLLPVGVAARCGIFDKQPQNVHVVANVKYTMNGARRGLRSLVKGTAASGWSTRLAPPRLILSPAVCYHYWRGAGERERGAALDVGTATGRCYRFEAPGLLGPERLREFTMWELFAVGEADHIETLRLRCLEYVKDLLVRLDLVGRVATASDPFFADVYARTRMFQVNMRLKHELQLWLPHKGHDVAVASVNDHRDFFTNAFGMTAQGRPLHSCCMAFGLERIALAALSQHGLDARKWPPAMASLMDGP
jgi:seryl-tRNA synthetase